MKQYLGLGLGVLVGTVIGAAAVSGLHAQASHPSILSPKSMSRTQRVTAKSMPPRPRPTSRRLVVAS